MKDRGQVIDTKKMTIFVAVIAGIVKFLVYYKVIAPETSKKVNNFKYLKKILETEHGARYLQCIIVRIRKY